MTCFEEQLNHWEQGQPTRSSSRRKFDDTDFSQHDRNVISWMPHSTVIMNTAQYWSPQAYYLTMVLEGSCSGLRMPTSPCSGIHHLRTFLGRKSGTRCLTTRLRVPWQLRTSQTSSKSLLPTAAFEGRRCGAHCMCERGGGCEYQRFPLAPRQSFLLDQEDNLKATFIMLNENVLSGHQPARPSRSSGNLGLTSPIISLPRRVRSSRWFDSAGTPAVSDIIES